MGKLVDLAGKTFGEYTVLDEHRCVDGKHVEWRCLCSCGAERWVDGYRLRTGRSTRCKSCVDAAKVRDLRGKRFGRLVAVENVGKDRHNNALWRCACDCGCEHIVVSRALVNGDAKSCGCLQREVRDKMASKSRKDVTGQRFGKLVAIEPTDERRGGYHVVWRCRCDCGGEKLATVDKLMRGDVTSCGCNTEHHGGWNDRLYGVWSGIKQRCNNPNTINYSDYGGRGIYVCDEWRNSYSTFRSWAMANGYNPDAPRGECTIDRIDNDGPYAPWNCRWVPMEVQANNKRDSAKVAADLDGVLEILLPRL